MAKKKSLEERLPKPTPVPGPDAAAPSADPINPFSGAGLHALMAALGVKDDAWDAVIVCDGSGSNQSRGSGWAAVVYDRFAKYRRLILGATNCAWSSNNAELMPALQAMMWYTESVGKYAATRRAPHPVRVHVVSDSQVTVQAGEKEKGKHPLWVALRAACGTKFQLTWHWLPRSTTDLNRLADYLSRAGRQELESFSEEAERRICTAASCGSKVMTDYNPVEDLPEDCLPPGAQ